MMRIKKADVGGRLVATTVGWIVGKIEGLACMGTRALIGACGVSRGVEGGR